MPAIMSLYIKYKKYWICIKEAAKQFFFLVAGPLGGGVAKRVCNWGKKYFFNVKKKVPMATKPRGGGAKGPIGRATKKRTFICGFPYLSSKINCSLYFVCVHFLNLHLCNVVLNIFLYSLKIYIHIIYASLEENHLNSK